MRRSSGTSGRPSPVRRRPTQRGRASAGRDVATGLEGAVQQVGERGRREQPGEPLQPAGQRLEREDHPADEEQEHVEAVRGGERGQAGQRARHAAGRGRRTRAVPSRTATSAASGARARRPPAEERRRRRSAATTCTTSTARIATRLRGDQRRRPSGVTPSRLSTPYWRSNPVAMAGPDHRRRHHGEGEHAGEQEVDGVVDPAGVGSTSTMEKKTRSTSGMPSVSSTDSPRRSVSDELGLGLGGEQRRSRLARCVAGEVAGTRPRGAGVRRGGRRAAGRARRATT